MAGANEEFNFLILILFNFHWNRPMELMASVGHHGSVQFFEGESFTTLDCRSPTPT